MEKMAEFHAEINFDSIEYSSGHVCILGNLLPYEKKLALGKNVPFVNIYLSKICCTYLPKGTTPGMNPNVI